MRRKIKRIGKVGSTLLTAVLFLLVLANIYVLLAKNMGGQPAPRVFGWSYAVVLSGSMSDVIEVDDMVLVHQEDNYQTGDIIMFQSGSSLVTHRIVDISKEGFVTKGDANNVVDSEAVAPELIVGKVKLVIPKVGAVIGFLQTPGGMLCLLAGGFLLLEYSFRRDSKAKNE